LVEELIQTNKAPWIRWDNWIFKDEYEN
jgi:hypothetical protein